MRANPFSKQGSWFPVGTLAYHAVFGASQRGFHIIWAEGELLSASERAEEVEADTQIMEVDEYAGDTQFVFFSLGQPQLFRDDPGYLFVLDPLFAVEELGALYGSDDLGPTYQGIIEALIEEVRGEEDYQGILLENFFGYYDLINDFETQAEEAQNAARVDGAEALDHIRRYLKRHPGRASTPPPEILVPERVSMSDLDAVIYDRIYFEVDDFRRLTRGASIDALLKATRHKGFPYRCPVCGEPVTEGAALAEVVRGTPWRRVRERGETGVALRCASHGGYFHLDDVDDVLTIEPDEDLGPLYGE